MKTEVNLVHCTSGGKVHIGHKLPSGRYSAPCGNVVNEATEDPVTCLSCSKPGAENKALFLGAFTVAGENIREAVREREARWNATPHNRAERRAMARAGRGRGR